MERADVLIVGGGPAGSSCAKALVDGGRDALVVDAAVFPRDKPCAGWITPEVAAEIPFSLEAYAESHVAQPITRFRVGRIGGRASEVDYGAPVSYGIRRREFDAELLRTSGARSIQGTRVVGIERSGDGWVVNGEIAADVLVGAGGHFCPVARRLGGPADDRALVVAREIEYPIDRATAEGCRVEEERPEIYFCRDMRGYGWCFRKGSWLNVGLGRLDARGLPAHVDGFLAFLARENRVASLPADGWRGHAYRSRRGRPRRLSGDGFALVGDAAGLSAPASGEGILQAIVSGRLAAEAILAGDPGLYERRLEERLGPPVAARRIPGAVAAAAGAVLLAFPGFARRVVLDRWFLHRSDAGGGASPPKSPSATRRSSPA